MRRVDRFLKLVATLRIRRALRVQGRGLPAGDNAGVSEQRASQHLLSLLGFGLDEPVPCPAEMHLAIVTEDFNSAEGQALIAAASKQRGTDEPIDILSEAMIEILSPALSQCRAAILSIIANEHAAELKESGEPKEVSLRQSLGDAVALALEQQFPAQEKLQLMRRRQIDDLVVLAIEKGLIDVVASIMRGFDRGRRTYDNPAALSQYQIVDGKLKLKITRKRLKKSGDEKSSDDVDLSDDVELSDDLNADDFDQTETDGDGTAHEQ